MSTSLQPPTTPHHKFLLHLLLSDPPPHFYLLSFRYAATRQSHEQREGSHDLYSTPASPVAQEHIESWNEVYGLPCEVATYNFNASVQDLLATATPLAIRTIMRTLETLNDNYNTPTDVSYVISNFQDYPSNNNSMVLTLERVVSTEKNTFRDRSSSSRVGIATPNPQHAKSPVGVREYCLSIPTTPLYDEFTKLKASAEVKPPATLHVNTATRNAPFPMRDEILVCAFVFLCLYSVLLGHKEVQLPNIFYTVGFYVCVGGAAAIVAVYSAWHSVQLYL